jgi:hypothetical protein
MNEKEGQNLLDFLATGINKNDTVIQAVLSDYDGNGATANELEALVTFIDYYTRTDDVKDHAGGSLEMIVKQFAKLRRQLEESDGVLLRRFRALTEREGDEIWGNGLNMEHIFETYFGGINAYICENTNTESLLQDGDFEEGENVWSPAGGAVYTNEARFSEKRGLFFSGAAGQTCTQTLTELSSGVYTFHFMLKGKCGVIIRDVSGKYFNASDEELYKDSINGWQTAPYTNWFDNDEWRDAYCFIVLKAETARLAIQFVSAVGREACIDYARFFLKPLNPSYTLVVQYEGYAVMDDTLHMGRGTVDPIQGVDYRKGSYFDKSYIVGRKGALQSAVYQSLLNTVKPRGIQAIVEFVEKTEIEEV